MIEKMIEAAAEGIHNRIWQGDIKLAYDSKDIKPMCMAFAKAALRAAFKALPDNRERLPNHETQALIRDGQIYQQLKDWTGK